MTFFYFLLLAGSFINQWSGREQGLWGVSPSLFSCWVLRSAAYLWDVARKEIPAESNFLRYLTYQTLFFFPTGGPVVLYQEWCAGGVFPAKCPWDRLSQGLRRLIRGLGKTLLLGAALWNFGDYAWKTEPPAPYGSAWQAVEWESIFSFPAFPTFPLGWAVCSGCISQKILTILSLPSALENFWADGKRR